MKHVVLVGGHDAGFIFFDKKICNFTVIQLDGSVGNNLISLTSNIELTESFSYEVLLALVKKINDLNPIDVIYSFTEDALLSTSEVAENLGLCGISAESCRTLLNKSKLREKLIGSKFEVPSLAVESTEQLERFLIKNKKIILKPKKGSGSEDIVLLNNINDIFIYLSSHDLSSAKFLAEMFIEGKEYSVETMSKCGCHEIVAITQKKLLDGTFAELQHISPPTDLKATQIFAIKEYVLSLLNALDYLNGPNHIEIKISGNDVHLIEVNNRVGGDFIAYIINSTTGRNLFQETLNIFLGNNDAIVNYIVPKSKICSSRSIFAEVNKVEVMQQLGDCKIMEYYYSTTEDSLCNKKAITNADKLGIFVFYSDCEDSIIKASESLDCAMINLSKNKF